MSEARIILGICDRFKCLPSQVMREEADVIRLMKIEALGKREEVNPDEYR